MARAVGTKIGDLARATGVQVETLRYYEREGLLPEPARSDGNFRLYGPEHTRRVEFIRHCRSLDIALDEIRVLLRFKDSPAENCQGVNALLDEHIGHVAERIRELHQLERQLKALRELCTQTQDAAHCGILAGLEHASPERAGARARGATDHVPGTHASSRRPRTPPRPRPR